MGSDGAQRLVSALEGAFRAALICEDDVAADDLAFSLAQDISIADELSRHGGTVLTAEAWRPIDVVGHDYLVAGNWLFPIGKAVVQLGGQLAPQREATILLSRLRHLARARATVGVGAGAAEFVGRLAKCSAGHLQIIGRRQMAIPFGQVVYVRLARGGSTDRPHDERSRHRDLGSGARPTRHYRRVGPQQRLRKRRLLTERSQRGSAVVESVFGIFFILLLSLGAVQVALTLYARNVVLAAVHDGARAAVEIGGAGESAHSVARRVVMESAGGLVRDLNIHVERRVIAERYAVNVQAAGTLVAPGPFPIEIPMRARASSMREVLDE